MVNALANVLKEEVGAERPLCYCLLIWLFTSVNGDQQPTRQPFAIHALLASGFGQSRHQPGSAWMW